MSSRASPARAELHGSDSRSIYLITGPPGAGKSTVARLLAQRLEPGVHLEGDVFRRSVVSGRHEMTPSASTVAVEQLRLRYRLAAQAADTYFAAGFNVVFEDIVAGPVLTELLGWITTRPLHVVVLLPSVDVIAGRDAARSASAYSDWDVATLHAGFAQETPRVGLWLDTSTLSPDETVEAILASPRTLAASANAAESHAPSGYECPFCAIVRGELREPPGTAQDDIVLRTPTTTAWISRRWWANNAGHALVVPNVHVENMYKLPRELAGDVHETARRIALALKAAYGCDGISTRQHNEPAGDQDVWHYHLHVFPCYEGDDLYGSPFRETTPEERRPYAERLRAALVEVGEP